MSMAVRIAKHRGELTPETTEILSRKTASKHYIPKSLRRELQIAPSLRRHHRHPKNATLAGPYCPGTTRLSSDLSRRLYYGERTSLDDGSQNQIACVPWPWGGTRESDRYGIRTMRGQWLLAHDDATSSILAWTFTMRPRDSYRDPDAMGLVWRMMRDVVKPDQAVCEGGVWQSKRAKAFYRAANVEVIDAKGRPHMKLIENWFNRAWTFLSHYDKGQIGRYRGEMQRENELLMRCRSGAVDGRKHFPLLPELLREFDECIEFLDQDRIESDQYGKWVPAERRAVDLAAHPRGRLESDLSPFAAVEAHTVKVRRGGMVRCKTVSPLGIPHPYEFADEALMPLEGFKVRVLWDPYEQPVIAVILAERATVKHAPGDMICSTVCINPPPVPVASEDWQVISAAADYGLAEAMARKKAIGRVVRTEYRALGDRGRKSMSEVRGPDGSMLRVEGGTADGATVTSTGAVEEALVAARSARKRRRTDATENDVAALEDALADELVIAR